MYGGMPKAPPSPVGMEEVISIHLGQAGCQVGSSLWELICLEHGLNEEGDLTTDADDVSPTSLFQETNSGQWVPRCLFLDLEPTVVDCIRTGRQKRLHHPQNIINATEDAANCWARGRFNSGKIIISETTERLRRLIERCSSVQGFIKFFAVGGGTGGGFGTLLRERVADEFFYKKQVVGACIYPSPVLSTCIVEPYNTVLATHSLVLKNDINIIYDNEALYRLCMNKLGLKNPNYTNLNRLIAQTISSMTQALRFDGELSMDFSELTTNLVPFPRINLLIGSLSPLQTDMEDKKDNYTVTDITMKCFANSNLMALCDINKGQFMACCCLYRGDVLPRNVNIALSQFKKQNKDRFVDWCPNMFKVGITYQPIVTVPGSALPEARRSVTMFVNTTSVYDIIAKCQEKQNKMWRKNAFKHWYIANGMEEGYMESCIQGLLTLREDYRWAKTSNRTISNFDADGKNYSFAGYYDKKYDTL